MVPLRVVVVDDHPVFREGLCALLDAFAEVEVAGQAANGHEAIEVVGRVRPDVVLMDLQMPGFNGIEATAKIGNEHPGVAVVILTMFDDDDSVFAAMRAGARGYLLKDADAADVLLAVRAAASGEAIFGPAIARRLIRYFSVAEPQAQSAPLPELTAAERTVLDLIAAGLSNSEIAGRLALSPKTIRNRVSTIFSKLQVRDRAQAIVLGREAGLGRETGPGPGPGPGPGGSDSGPPSPRSW
jgi:DNA-binding NarL/FixJ family response regulator